mgnify:FL=1
MSWNPDNKDKDPWGNRPGNQGPPDLDEVVKKMQEGLGKIFGGGGGQKKSSEEPKGPILLIAGALFVLLLGYEMVYRIDPAERGVVMRFGKYVTSLQPGPHIRLPRPIEEVIKVNVERIQTITSQSSMLTGDENIVEVELAVQYRIKVMFIAGGTTIMAKLVRNQEEKSLLRIWRCCLRATLLLVFLPPRAVTSFVH